MSSVYPINKGVDRPVSFKGLQGQWIGWMAFAVLLLLLLFAVCYLFGVSLFAIVPLVLIAGTVAIIKIVSLSKKYGQHGLLKKMAAARVPKAVKNDIVKMKKSMAYEKSI